QVVITDELPAELALTGLSGPADAEIDSSDPRRPRVIIPSLGPGQSRVIALATSPVASGEAVTIAVVTTTDFDTSLSDNTASAAVTITNAVPAVGPDPDALALEDEDVTVTLSASDGDADPLTALITTLRT